MEVNVMVSAVDTSILLETHQPKTGNHYVIALLEKCTALIQFQILILARSSFGIFSQMVDIAEVISADPKQMREYLNFLAPTPCLAQGESSSNCD